MSPASTMEMPVSLGVPPSTWRVDRCPRKVRPETSALVSPSSRQAGLYRRREAVVRGVGDTAEMLALPSRQSWLDPQTVSVRMVSDRAGRRWRASRDSQVLLLGDSFSNVYSDPALGWGASAGLAEQLSYHLQRPVDKLAVNAGGALQTRLQLQRSLLAGDDRLSGKSIVVYQFATRELSHGDWRVLHLQP